jgi:hypothetical protein
MLGSFQDAEDALQDTLLAGWHGLGVHPPRSRPSRRVTICGPDPRRHGTFKIVILMWPSMRHPGAPC